MTAQYQSPPPSAGYVKLEYDVNTGGRIGLEALTHTVKYCLNIAAA